MPAKSQINKAIRDEFGNIIPWKKRNRAVSNATERARRARNPEKVRSENRKYRENNPFNVAVIVARRRAKLLGVESALTVAEWEQIVHESGFQCHLCKEPIIVKLDDPLTLSLDHIIPMSVGGPNTKENVAPAHRRCNQARLDMSVEEFLIWIRKVAANNKPKFIITAA
jgi:5-methylcytosine-specific restriction endonuclease McrA